MDSLGRFGDATFAVVDVETTGLDPRADRVVEVACVLCRGGRRLATFESLVDPQRPIPAFATRIHNIGDDDVRGAPTLAELADRLSELARDAVVVAHNASFDARFLPFLSDRPWLCTMRLARIAVPDAPAYRNQVLREHLRIRDPEADGIPAHSALGDAMVTSHILARCIPRFLALGHDDNVEAAVRYVATPRALRVLPFGKHRGQPVTSIPGGYLRWLLSLDRPPEDDVRLTAAAELARRYRRPSAKLSARTLRAI
jgi:DNA polymerase III epsilon subunit-like protein